MGSLTIRNRLDPDNAASVLRSMGLGALLFAGQAPTVTPSTNFDFFVSTAGNNSWNGLFPTFQSGLNGPKRDVAAAMPLMSAGKSLGVRGGTYAELFGIGAIPSGTSWTNKVRIANYNGETVWLKPNSGQRILDFGNSQQYIEFDGINLDAEFMGFDCAKVNCVTLGTEAHHIRFQNLQALGTLNSIAPFNTGNHLFLLTALVAGSVGNNEVINVQMSRNPGSGPGSFSHGCYCQSHGNRVEWCTLDGGGLGNWNGNGIQIYNGQIDQGPIGTIVQYNIIRNFASTVERGRGIELGFNANSALIYSNLIHDISGVLDPSACIRVDGFTHTILNNTCANHNQYGIKIDSGSHILRNNIAWNCALGNFYNPNNIAQTSSNNLGDTESGWTNLNPLFIGGGNFRLQSTSPGKRTSGSFIGSFDTNPPVTLDLDRVLRHLTSPSLGAYE